MIHLLFYKRLFTYAGSEVSKQLLGEILSCTEAQVDQEISTLIQRKKSPSAAEAAMSRNEALIQEIIDVSATAIDQLTKETAQFRHKLMYELRMSHGMSQDHFKALYKTKYPNYPMSDGTMHNLENGIKKITQPIIQQLSEIFSVHQSLFYPLHFATSESSALDL